PKSIKFPVFSLQNREFRDKGPQHPGSGGGRRLPAGGLGKPWRWASSSPPAAFPRFALLPPLDRNRVRASVAAARSRGRHCPSGNRPAVPKKVLRRSSCPRPDIRQRSSVAAGL